MERNRSNEKSGAMRDLHAWMKQLISQNGVETPVHDEFGGFIGNSMQAQVVEADGRIIVSVEQFINEWEKGFFESAMRRRGIIVEPDDVMLLAFGNPRDALTEAYVATDTNVARKSADDNTEFYPLEDYEIEMLCVSLGVEGYWPSE